MTIETETEINCKHRFKVLREGKSVTIFLQSVDTILQCEKCLALYSLNSYGNELRPLKERRTIWE